MDALHSGLAGLGAVLIFSVVAASVSTRPDDAGHGCADWRDCYSHPD